MISWRKAICGIIFCIVFIFGFLFFRQKVCSMYNMDYALLINQCVVRR